MVGAGCSVAVLSPELESNFIDIMTDCPYGLEQEAMYHQACLGILPDLVMEELLAAGCRRNGNVVYAMRCPECSACVPIRVRARHLRLNRNQRRCLVKNRDVETGIAPLTMSKANLDLLDRFLAVRFPVSRHEARDYYSDFFYNSITSTLEIRYRVAGRLIGVSVVDIGENWLNAVYFFFDPAESQRSLGTFNILYLSEFCRRHQMEYLYLGYCIEQVPAMRYKSRFHPHEILMGQFWQQVCSRSGCDVVCW